MLYVYFEDLKNIKRYKLKVVQEVKIKKLENGTDVVYIGADINEKMLKTIQLLLNKFDINEDKSLKDDQWNYCKSEKINKYVSYGIREDGTYYEVSECYHAKN